MGLGFRTINCKVALMCCAAEPSKALRTALLLQPAEAFKPFRHRSVIPLCS